MTGEDVFDMEKIGETWGNRRFMGHDRWHSPREMG